ncbi:Lecithin retinol acyltransferase [Alteromonadaceae bacterium Bs31]|nr:Lecithin retinol acyltransferase [Alteromonadaceae bacterium Bs31]
MQLNQIDVTGCRVIGAITRELGHAGPKHHGVLLGQSPENNQVYIAENMHFGYQVCTYSEFFDRYSQNGEIIIQPNDGPLENISVAQRAIEELRLGGKGVYNLATNNCECFVNRAMHGKSVSNQVINTAIGIAVLAGVVYVLKKSK